MRARLWIHYRGSPARITVQPGKAVELAGYQSHEEGWSSWRDTYEVIGDTIERYSESDGTDCDGRLSTEDTSVVNLDSLQVYGPVDGVLWPAWERLTASQRDYTAEAAGY